MDPVDIVNAVATFLFVGLLVAAVARMAWRLSLFHFRAIPVPLLLKRDLVFFGSLTLVFGLILLFRFFGVTGLSRNLAWIGGTDLLILGGLAVWVYVEFKEID